MPHLPPCSQAARPTTAPVEDKSGTASPHRPTPGHHQRHDHAAASAAPAARGANPLRDPNNILSKRSVYFEFDSFTVADQYKPMVEAHAKYLAANRSARVTLQGHADERGSREYNIALGQKRADAVKRMMTLHGRPGDDRRDGELRQGKAENMGHDEAAWAENRRVDIIYAGE